MIITAQKPKSYPIENFQIVVDKMRTGFPIFLLLKWDNLRFCFVLNNSSVPAFGKEGKLCGPVSV